VQNQKLSAGLLMYRRGDAGLEVFLAHPGGPFFARKDRGHWTIPKGEVKPGESLLEAAIREFEEEIGMAPHGEYLPVGSIRQYGGKTVHGWAFEGDWPSGRPVRSHTYRLEWPPTSGKFVEAPEIDRAQFFSVREALIRIKDRQRPFIERLQAALGLGARPQPQGAPPAPAS
jgi:predicted NUDIX family NTP pyrophosphohydrolase